MLHRQLTLSLIVGSLFLLRVLFPQFFLPLESIRLLPAQEPLLPPSAIALVPLRYLAAFVFLWFAFDNFESPRQFHTIGNLVLRKIGFIREVPLAWLSYTQGFIELLVAISFMIGLGVSLAALVGSIIVSAVILAFKFGNGTLLARDLGVLGGTITLFLLTV